MSRSLRLTIKYFTLGLTAWLFVMTIRPILHALENHYGTFPFWVWKIETPLTSLTVIGIVIFWGYQTYQRIIQKAQRRMFCAICYCSASWAGIVCAENVFFTADNPLIKVLQRLLWYSYYIPWMAIPLLMLLTAEYIGKSNLEKIDRRLLLLWIPYGLINLGIMTNDLHEQAFGFPEGIENWRTVYTHGWLFYAAYSWIFVVSLVTFYVIWHRTRVPSTRKYTIFPLMTLAMGQLLSLAVFHKHFYLRISDVCIFAFGMTLEVCIRCNLFPNNVHYADLIKNPEFQVYIYDDKYNQMSKPEGAEDMVAKSTPFMLDKYHRVNSAKVFGGYVYWVEDETVVHNLRDEMEEIQELLKEESSLIKEENELKKRKISVSIKRQLYDSISEFSTPLINQMEAELDALSEEDDPKKFAHLCVQMAYLKRRSNMVLKEQENGRLPLEELYNAVYEPFSYLDYLGIYAYPNGRLEGYEDGDLIIALYDLFYKCLTDAFDELSAILVNFSEDEDNDEISLHMMMNVKEPLTEEKKEALLSAILWNPDLVPEIKLETSYDDEEGTIYIPITLKRGGAGLC